MSRQSLTLAFAQSHFDRFARLSGDANPIHVDADFSARTRFGRTVAHGVLLETVLRGLADRLVPGGAVIEQALRFTAPTYADEPMRFEVWRQEDGTLGLAVTRAPDGPVTCEGWMALAPARGSPPPGPATRAAELSGRRASLTRSFSGNDIAEYVALGGHAASPESVPEPLIGALFSRLLGMDLPGLGTNYLKQETRHHASARTDEPLTAQVIITRLRPEKHLVDLATLCHGADGRLIAEGRALVYVRDAVRFEV